MLRKLLLLTATLLPVAVAFAQKTQLAPTPPMGYMTWNYYADRITAQHVKTIADAMVANGLRDAGYDYIFIDDGWQGGRDNKNNIIPDAVKFPGGMKALADYVHSKGLKLGIYSDAAPLTCAGYTASLHFEDQDARTFAGWGIDYLKYDYCNAPEDSATAKVRYHAMAEALSRCGRNIPLGICEWGGRQPWNWAAAAGGSLWRIAGDIRDKWAAANDAPGTPTGGVGILDAVNADAPLDKHAGPGGWNDPDMLVVGLYGYKGPSGDLGGVGCTDVEYRSQMSLWCLMAAPLMVSCDVTKMNAVTRAILTNKDILAIDQDPLGMQAVRTAHENDWQVFVKTLANGDTAIGILNTANTARRFDVPRTLLDAKFATLNVWTHEKRKSMQTSYMVAAHETMVLRLIK